MRKCNLCGSSESYFLFSKFGFDIVKCKSCGFIYVEQDMSLEELKQHYNKGYFFGANKLGYKNYIEAKDTRMKKFQGRLAEIENMKKKGRILDVGCAMGFFLEVARRNGWEIFGVELSEYACKYAKKKFGINIYNCDLAQADFSNNYFDVITMWDAIEHLLNPMDNLREAYRILKKGGILAITTGDVSNLNAKIFGKNWVIYSPPCHLYYFSRKTLKNALSKIGFSIIKIFNRGLPFCNSNSPSDYSRILRIIFNKYTRLITQKLNIGDVITVYASK